MAAWWLTYFERAGYTPALRALIIALSIDYIWSGRMVWISAMLRIWAIRPGLLANPDSDRVLGAALYHFLPFMLTAFLAVWLRWSKSLSGVLIAGSCLMAYLLWLDSSGLWLRSRGWSPVLEGAVLTLIILMVSLLDDWFGAEVEAETRTG